MATPKKTAEETSKAGKTPTTYDRDREGEKIMDEVIREMKHPKLGKKALALN